MGQEIERKFLVKHSLWHNINKPKGTMYRQGYLLTNPDKTIRVRQTDNVGFLTIKGKSVGASRMEYEYEIPLDEARELLDNFADAELSKIRYCVEHEGKVWEVDEFLGDNTGLIVAEIELNYETESFLLPEWIDIEVTEDIRYYNSNLTLVPFKDWVTK